MNRVPYVLGIDGGGTKTQCAVGDESKLLATATAGPSNVLRVGETQAPESHHHSVSPACAAAGITPPQLTNCSRWRVGIRHLRRRFRALDWPRRRRPPGT